MRHTLDKPSAVLYHAVSSYQLLEVMLHRMVKHPRDQAVLLLPDFIVGKYPQYKKLSRRFSTGFGCFPICKYPIKAKSRFSRIPDALEAVSFPRSVRLFHHLRGGCPFLLFVISDSKRAAVHDV